MIDLHIHGAMGADVMDGSVESLEIISKALYKNGVTGFVPATMTESLDKIQKALDVIKQFKKPEDGADVLGVYLEGPFLSREKTGAQDSALIQKPTIEWFKQLRGDLIKIVAIAPEEDAQFNLIKFLKNKNIISSIAHTSADFEMAEKAIDAGCSHATHLFNAMKEIQHRDPGAVTACLLNDRVTLELLVDGVHLHPAIVKLVYRLCGPERIILVSDSMCATGLTDGDYALGGQKVMVKNGVARLENGALAGSTLTMPQAVKNMMKFTGCSLQDTIKMTAENPAKKLNIFNKKGSIAIGKDADFCIVEF
jgi:N-acetylglucosamine-6-phosphate deacetylase